MKKTTITALNASIDRLLLAGKWHTKHCKQLRKLHAILTKSNVYVPVQSRKAVH